MFDSHFVGLDITGFENNGKLRPISRVTLLLDNENVITAGDDTGLEITADCPHATQEMANDLLTKLKGYQYQMYSADDANLDPAAELGDGVNVGGIYSTISNMNDDGNGYPSVSAPGEEELEDEYPAAGPMTQAFNRQIAETKSSITKTAEEIRLEVENEVSNISASISVQIDNITSEVKGLENSVSSISQKVDSITLEVTNSTNRSYISLMMDGVEISSQTIRFTGNVVFESDLRSGNTVISGDCIQTGEIEADYLKLGGPMEVYRTSSSNMLGGYIGYITSQDYSGNTTRGMGMMNADEDCQVVVTDAGARLTSPYGEIVTAVNITLDTSRSVDIYSSKFTSEVDLQVTSDERFKDEISYDVEEKYVKLFDKLRPVSFRFKKKGNDRHLGFIAQDVQKALFECGLNYEDFAALDVSNKDRYGIVYGEFIPLLVSKIQQLEKRLESINEGNT